MYISIYYISNKHNYRLNKAFKRLGGRIVTVRSFEKESIARRFYRVKIVIKVKKMSLNTLVHEYGHFLYYLKKVYLDNKWTNIYYAERNKVSYLIKRNFITKSSSEYLAESYANYRINPNELKKTRPRTYQYINDKATTITNNDITKNR